MTAAIVGFGYGLMRLVTPTEKQFYDSLAPDLKRKADEMRRAREAEEKRLSQQPQIAHPHQPILSNQPKK